MYYDIVRDFQYACPEMDILYPQMILIKWIWLIFC